MTHAGPVLIALGSNLGDRAANLREGLRLMRGARITPVRVSSAWESAPVPEGQPWYLNAVASVETDLSPPELLAILKQIEHVLGRRPGKRWAPRPIDLDILFHGDRQESAPGLVLPHPRIAERPFVLAPLSEVWHGPLPVFGRSALDLLAGAPSLAMVRSGVSLDI